MGALALWRVVCRFTFAEVPSNMPLHDLVFVNWICIPLDRSFHLMAGFVRSSIPVLDLDARGGHLAAHMRDGDPDTLAHDEISDSNRPQSAVACRRSGQYFCVS
jgi:hypothetical protein